MPKTENNSTRCSCCHRYMARKAGKRITCSPICQATVKAGARFQTKAERLSRPRRNR